MTINDSLSALSVLFAIAVLIFQTSIEAISSIVNKNLPSTKLVVERKTDLLRAIRLGFVYALPNFAIFFTTLVMTFPSFCSNLDEYRVSFTDIDIPITIFQIIFIFTGYFVVFSGYYFVRVIIRIGKLSLKMQ